MNITLRNIVLIAAFTLLAFQPSYAQHEAFIYGEVLMKNKQSYRGQIRWSAGQVLWGDLLLANKEESSILKYLTKEQLKNLSGDKAAEGVDWQFINLWRYKYSYRTHAVKSRFGDIASLRITGDKKISIIYKDGSEIKAIRDEDNHSNIGHDIIVYDSQSREIRLEWNEIDRIRFMQGPSLLPNINGTPIYGTLNTTNGPLSGIILWDRYKSLTTSRLYGRTNMGRYPSYAFSEIKSIEKRDKGAFVKFRSGDELMLRESRDVNSSNRGIIVLNPVFGRIVVDWRAFISVSFSETISKGFDYKSYLRPKKLLGDIRGNDGKNYSGNFVFDLDEALNIELLDGNTRGINYQIPFSSIQKIIPVDEHSTDVVLKTGEKMHLSNQDDVTERNWGIMLWLPKSKYKYFSWDHISEITLK